MSERTINSGAGTATSTSPPPTDVGGSRHVLTLAAGSTVLVLLAFVTHPKRVLTRDQLLDLSQGRELAAFERSIDNHVSRLRRKIEADPSDPKLIKTVWGGGYTLAADVTRLRAASSRPASSPTWRC